MLIIFQILFVGFALFAVQGVVQKYRAGQIGPKGTAFWVLFWFAVATAVVWPEGTAKLASLFAIGRGVDFVIYIAIATLFYLIFRLHVKIESIGKDVTRIVRDMAITEAKEPKKRS